MAFDATFWAFVALVIFIGIALYIKVPGMIGSALDKRANKITADLEGARRLREEAQQLLAEYQRKRKEAEAEASDIVDAAKREASALVAEAKVKTEDYIKRRSAQAEQKIAQAERDAVNEVRSVAVDVATEAARAVLAGRTEAKAVGDLFKESLAAVKSKLN
jgi:F-type H+-transporting ATPase subunit b